MSHRLTAKPIMIQQKVKQGHISQSSFLWNQEMSFFLPSFLIRFSGFRMISFFFYRIELLYF